MKILQSQLEREKQGVLYLLENNFLSNANPRTNMFPPGEPVEYFLFMGRGEKGKKYEWFIHTITALNKKTADQELQNIANRKDVILVESRRTLNVMPKNWQERER